MRTTLVLVAVAASAAVLPACSRTDTHANNTPADSADIRASSVPPETKSTSQTTPPALPPTPALPHGAGDAAPAAAAAPPPGNAPSSASNATKEATPPVAADTDENGKPGSAQDTVASNPMGQMSKGEESSAMPKAGQVNNYSTPALETSRGRPSQQQ